MAPVGAERCLDDAGLGLVIDLDDEVVRRLGVDLEQIEVERGAVDDHPGVARRLDRRVEHGVKCLGH